MLNQDEKTLASLAWRELEIAASRLECVTLPSEMVRAIASERRTRINKSKEVYDPSLYGFPPDDIIEAAVLIERWFRERGVENWKLLGVQSRGLSS